MGVTKPRPNKSMWKGKGSVRALSRPFHNVGSSTTLVRCSTIRTLSSTCFHQNRIHDLVKGAGSARMFHATHARHTIVDFPLADIGEGIKEVEILQWLVKEGDSVQEFDKLCEVQSDKANVEISSRYAGKILKLHHKVGEMAKVHHPLVTIQTASTVEVSTPTPTPKQMATPPQPQAPLQQPAATQNHNSDNDATHKPLTTPAVRHIAKSNHIDLNTVVGTGKEGRIMKHDILSHISGSAQQQAVPQDATATQVDSSTPTSATSPSTAPAPTSSSSSSTTAPTAGVSLNEDRVVPIQGIAKAMFKSMTASTSIPQFLFCDEIDVTSLVALRARLKPLVASSDSNLSLTFMPFFIKAASMALSKYPILNASISSDQNSIIYHASHNIGFAVDTPHGLVVPNIKQVERLSLLQITREMARLQEAAMAKKLSISDTKGGTFTLSNIGSFGGTYASPIVFAPEVAIGAFGKIQKLPRFDEAGNVVARQLMNTSWSADHRVIEGAVITRFSNEFKKFLQDPDRMFLEL
eukprot:c10142_g1_i1.p1 GENE.c10142_g1_i1~~c10142_g1_i1.p1  ORF type:complete len:523 (-),score=137.21 c10142_g1_i1:290-1858(-)